MTCKLKIWRDWDSKWDSGGRGPGGGLVTGQTVLLHTANIYNDKIEYSTIVEMSKRKFVIEK